MDPSLLNFSIVHMHSRWDFCCTTAVPQCAMFHWFKFKKPDQDLHVQQTQQLSITNQIVLNSKATNKL